MSFKKTFTLLEIKDYWPLILTQFIWEIGINFTREPRFAILNLKEL